MISTPKNLSDIEIGLYLSGYEFCKKLVKEDHMDISVAVEIGDSKEPYYYENNGCCNGKI